MPSLVNPFQGVSEKVSGDRRAESREGRERKEHEEGETFFGGAQEKKRPQGPVKDPAADECR